MKGRGSKCKIILPPKMSFKHWRRGRMLWKQWHWRWWRRNRTKRHNFRANLLQVLLARNFYHWHWITYSYCSIPCSSNFPKTKAYGHARCLMKEKSISLKNRLEFHVVMPLAACLVSCHVSIKHLLDNFYLAFSLKDHTSHWPEERNSREIHSLESFIFLFYVCSYAASAQGGTTTRCIASNTRLIINCCFVKIAAVILIVINRNTGETLAFLKWQEKLQSNEKQEFSWVWGKSTCTLLNAAEWTWKRPRKFLTIMKSHLVTENYCEYSVKTIINKQS